MLGVNRVNREVTPQSISSPLLLLLGDKGDFDEEVVVVVIRTLRVAVFPAEEVGVGFGGLVRDHLVGFIAVAFPLGVEGVAVALL